MSFREYLNEGKILDKIKKFIQQVDTKMSADTRSKKEIIKQVQELDDETLLVWKKNQSNPALSYHGAIQFEMVDRELKRRNLK